LRITGWFEGGREECFLYLTEGNVDFFMDSKRLAGTIKMPFPVLTNKEL
jgi:hypothetical protein